MGDPPTHEGLLIAQVSANYRGWSGEVSSGDVECAVHDSAADGIFVIRGKAGSSGEPSSSVTIVDN